MYLRKVIGCWVAIFLGIILLMEMKDKYGWLAALTALALFACGCSAFLGLLSRRRPK
jgi:hypothetical protein